MLSVSSRRRIARQFTHVSSKISTFLLNLYNFNGLEPVDRVLLGIGIPLAFLWLGIGVGMVRNDRSLAVRY